MAAKPVVTGRGSRVGNVLALPIVTGLIALVSWHFSFIVHGMIPVGARSCSAAADSAPTGIEVSGVSCHPFDRTRVLR